MAENKDWLAAARSVLEVEAKGVAALETTLGPPLAELLETVRALKGRVVVSGMGKSGHIARKIAATLTSTGTPAYFLHPGEASHGDLGLIESGDFVLALSNSGETSEMGDLVRYCKAHGIPLAAITRNPKSSLVKSADIALVLPASKEACPNGLAPTTSTTQSLVLGDMIAVALMQARGFDVKDFRRFHPGGKLGLLLKCARDFMRPPSDLALVSPDERMDEVIIKITAKGLGAAVVVDESLKILGIITDGDLRRHLTDDLLKKRAADIMTPDAQTIAPDLLAQDALAAMSGKITQLLVAEEGHLLGMVRMHELVAAGVEV